jgi:hypothetical protein
VNQKNNNQVQKMKNIATKLGLAAEASEDAILAEVTKIQNRVAELQPLAAENTTLKNRVTELDAANVDALLAGHGVKDAKVLNRMKPILVATPAADRQACLDELIPKAPGGAATGAAASNASSQTKLHNRDTRPPGAAATEENGGQADASKAQKIMNRATAIRKETPNVSHATAVLMAQRELEATD